MPRFLNLKNSLLAVAAFGLLALTHATVKADPISVCTGAGCSTTNVTGTIVAGNGTVTITLNNNLTNAQVVSVIQNVSGVYFQVSGYNGGAVSLSDTRLFHHKICLQGCGLEARNCLPKETWKCPGF
jgi:hypothetical protein